MSKSKMSKVQLSTRGGGFFVKTCCCCCCRGATPRLIVLALCLPLQVPLRLIESVEGRDMFQLHIICKDSKVVR